MLELGAGGGQAATVGGIEVGGERVRHWWPSDRAKMYGDTRSCRRTEGMGGSGVSDLDCGRRAGTPKVSPTRPEQAGMAITSLQRKSLAGGEAQY
jgi:hypothetical protein